jgi:chemotaxis protein MotC
MRSTPTAEGVRGRCLAGWRASLCCALAGAAIAIAATDPATAAPPAEAEAPAETATEAAVETERLVQQLTARQPHHAVRALGILQERIAHGDEGALALLRPLVEDIGDELKTFPPEVWKSPRNRLALIKFALSGGDPIQLRLVLARKLLTATEQPLAEGAIAYAEGQRSLALRLLDRVDLYELPPSLAGHVALVKAIVIANGDLKRVLRLADDARLLSPGTLVEETALRLAVEATNSLGDRKRFEAMVLRYFRRYPRSPYLPTVIRPVAAAIADGGYGEHPEGAKWVHSIVHYLDPGRLVQFYSALADAGLRTTKLATAISAARMAQRYVRPGTPEQAWAFAYEGAALVVGPTPREGLARLDAAEAISPGGPIDDLITGSRALAKLILAPPNVVPEPTAIPIAEPAQSGAADASKSAPPAREPAAVRTLARIAQVDKLLKETE